MVQSDDLLIAVLEKLKSFSKYNEFIEVAHEYSFWGHIRTHGQAVLLLSKFNKKISNVFTGATNYYLLNIWCDSGNCLSCDDFDGVDYTKFKKNSKDTFVTVQGLPSKKLVDMIVKFYVEHGAQYNVVQYYGSLDISAGGRIILNALHDADVDFNLDGLHEVNLLKLAKVNSYSSVYYLNNNSAQRLVDYILTQSDKDSELEDEDYELTITFSEIFPIVFNYGITVKAMSILDKFGAGSGISFKGSLDNLEVIKKLKHFLKNQVFLMHLIMTKVILPSKELVEEISKFKNTKRLTEWIKLNYLF